MDIPATSLAFGGMSKRENRRWPRLALAGAALTLVLVVVGTGALYAYDTRGEERTLRNLYLGTEPIGSLTVAELRTTVDRLRTEAEQRPVTINLPDRAAEITARELGITLDDTWIEEAAMTLGRTGTVVDRTRAWLASFSTPRRLPHRLLIDPEVADQRVASLEGLMVEEPREPRLILDSASELSVVPGEAGLEVDTDSVVDRLRQQVEEGGPLVVDAPTRAVPPAMTDAEAAELARRLNALTAGGMTVVFADERRQLSASALRVRMDTATTHDGVPAPNFDLESLQRLLEHTFADVNAGGSDPVFDVVDDQPVLIEEGTPPVQCCRQDAAAMLANAVLAELSDPVHLPERPSTDPRRIEWAAGVGVVEKVAEFTTNHNCCEARVQNIQRFADIVRGVYLEPGETLSLNGYVGERTRDRGFVPAGTILRGHLVPTVGGGVSQFATTMFNAAFFAGFDFVDYQSHSIYFSRYPYGREATISWPAPDLVFTNTTDYPALIWTSYTPTAITVSIYSTVSVRVEQSHQETSRARQCTRVETFRLRTYLDGRQVEDSVEALYRPGEGLDCNGNPTPRPNE